MPGRSRNAAVTAMPKTASIACLLMTCWLAWSSPVALAGDGQPDPLFEGNGKAVVGFSEMGNPVPATGSAVKILPDGKILLGGYWFSPALSSNVITLARLTADGYPDISFGNTGIVYQALPDTAEMGYLLNLALQPDGKILLMGIYGNRAFLARTNANGSLDSSFGQGGRLFYPATSSDQAAFGAGAILASGHIFISGTYYDEEASSAGLLNVLFDASGALLAAQVITDVPAPFYDAAMLVQDDGKVVIASSASPQCAVVRVNVGSSSLGLDGSFGVGGIAPLNWNQGGSNFCHAIAQQRDGRLIVAGEALRSDDGIRAMVTRLQADGSPDAAFGKKAFSVVSSASHMLNDFENVLIQNDGRIVLTGSVDTNDVTHDIDFAALRLQSDGTLDATFGATTPYSSIGKVVVGFETGSNPSADNTRAAVLQGNRVVMAGTRQRSDNGIDQFAVLRLQNDAIFANDCEN
jgi:uncharacterized delta-60 repeat protein